MSSAELRRQAAIQIITQRGWITMRMLADRFSVSRGTARKDLLALVEAGTLSRMGKASETYYILADPPNEDPPGKAA